MKGLVIKKNANLFSVEEELTGNVFLLHASGKTQDGGVYVGDKVEFDKSITSVCKRKNLIIRPPLANLDKLFIVIAPVPKPDLLLVDKMIVYCFVNGITPILVVNKQDLTTETFVKTIKNIYNKVVEVVFVSAKEKEATEVQNKIFGICAFAGQSAVGKSSLINCLFEKNLVEVGQLSKKIDRGKQTTRMVQLFKYNKGYIADTAGFSMLSLAFVTQLEPRELASYYPDFLEARANCKYRSCLHEDGDCGVIKDVKSGKITQERYLNYLKILQELKNRKKY